MIKRPMLIITVSYIMGIILGLYLEINMALFVLITGICILFGLSIFIFVYKKGKLSNKLIMISICIMVMIISTSIVLLKEHKFKVLYEGIGDDTKFIGTVISVQKDNQYYYNYIVKIKSIDENKDELINLDRNKKGRFKNTCILLKIKKNNNNKIEGLEYGDLIAGMGNFEKPAGRRNYKGYDYSQYLKTKNIYMICTSNAEDVKVVKKSSQFITNMWINKLKNKLKSNISSLLSEENSNIAIALLLGDSSLIESEQRQVFSDASLSHILAISGMHVTYVILGLSYLLNKFDKRKGKYIIIFFLIFFSQLTGASPSIIRAAIMSGVMVISKLVYRKSDTINNIALSCLIILIINPYNILSLGFQLSFLGTLGIVLFNKKIKEIFERNRFVGFVQYFANNSIIAGNDKSKSKYRKTLIKKFLSKIISKCISIVIICISANILIFPILIYTSNNFSFTFLISNILVTPILGIMFSTGYLTLIISLISMQIAKFIAIPFDLCIKILGLIAKFGSDLSFFRFTVTTPSIICIVCYYIIIIYMFYFYRTSHNKIVVKIFTISVILVFLFQLPLVRNYGLKIHFIDVGQGDSTLIITKDNKKILIDGGGNETGSYDVGESILVPYLLDRKIKSIDYIIFSHFDSDHCKGLFTVMDKLNVKNVVISKQGSVSNNFKHFLELAKSRKINIICVKARKQA